MGKCDPKVDYELWSDGSHMCKFLVVYCGTVKRLIWLSDASKLNKKGCEQNQV